MKYYQHTIDQVLDHLGTSAAGLTQSAAEQRLQKSGLNEVQTHVGIHRLALFLSQFKSSIIYILLFAVALSFLTGEWFDGLIILVILLANALIGYAQELSAHQSLQALQQFNRITTRVRRDASLVETDARFLVPGDVIELTAGDRVPADCRLLEVNELKVQESALTGESISVHKKTDVLSGELPLGDRSNLLFSATDVIAGMATAVVVKTGDRTQIGHIARLIRDAGEDRTPLQKKLDAFGRRFSWVVTCVCVLLFVIISYQASLRVGFDLAVLRELALVAVALAVAAVPEGLPAVVTITLSIGVRKLLKKRIIVKRLSSVESLGSCDVICTDKTGTLTRNEMKVTHVWTPDGEAELSGLGYEPVGQATHELAPLVYEIGMVCNKATVHQENGEWRITGDPTEAALLVSGMKIVEPPVVRELQLLPFDSTRKKMSVLIERAEQSLVYTKGAPDPMLDTCTHVLIEQRIEPLTDELAEHIREHINRYASQALRVIAMAYKPVQPGEPISEDGLVFVGLQAMIDPPRDDVIESLKKTRAAGIRVVMITGDYQQTAMAIGQKIGIEGHCMEGSELSGLSEQQVGQVLAGGVNIFTRTVPEDKQKIVAALQNQGSIVAMTGDGINDAPALKKADIGVAVGSGTDVAKEASDLILLDDSFTHIVNAIEEGRGIFDNIQKTILLLLSGNLSEVLIVVMAVLLGWDLPLTVIMILWINLISDGAPALALAIDPYGQHIMHRQPRPASAGLLSGQHIMLVVGLAAVITVCALWLFHERLPVALDQAQTLVFNVIIVAEVGLLFAIRFLFHTPPLTNRWLWLTVVLTLLIQLLIMYTPARQLFGITPLDLHSLLWVLMVAGLVYVIGVLLVLLNRRYPIPGGG